MLKQEPSSSQLTIDQAFQVAVTNHKNGDLNAAEQLYRSILAAVPNHPDTNHNLGVLAVQVNQVAAGLPYLKTALEGNPRHLQYWLSYVDALIKTGQTDTARQVLQQGRKLGLAGDTADRLEQHLQDSPPIQSPAAQVADQNESSRPQKAAKMVDARSKRAGRQPLKGGPLPATTVSALLDAFNAGNYADVERMARKITRDYPFNGFGWKSLGAALRQQGKITDAVLPMQKAVQLMPNDAESHYNLGGALQCLGHSKEAEASYRKAIALKPDYVEVYCNLGDLLQAVDRLAEAEATYRKAISLNPDCFEAYNNLGNVLQEMERLEEAQACQMRAIALKPDCAEIYYNLGNTLRDLGRFDQAEASYRKAIILCPDYADAYGNLGVILKNLGRFDQAEACCRQALVIKPDLAGVYNNLGDVLQTLGRLKEAEASCRQALALKPDLAEAYSNLGDVLQHSGHLEQAEACCRQAIALKPGLAAAHNNLGLILQDLGRVVEAEASYRQAITLKPEDAEAHSNLLFLLNYAAGRDTASCLEEAFRYGCVVSSKVKERFTSWQCTPQPEKLRVGIVSGDLRNHAVGYFLESLLAQFDPARIELIAYPTNYRSDALTERIRPCFSQWKPLISLSDEAAAKMIHGDAVHILLDLSGHTADNRLPVFAWKPAPVQAHYLGYFASTGVEQMDYWIGDKMLTPPETDHHFSETVWRLPRLWVSYQGAPEAPIPHWQPTEDGAIWLGSFNNLRKLTSATFALWAKVLHALPEGKLLLKTKELASEQNRQRILAAFAYHGIEAERIALLDRTITPDWASHMAYYDRLDIALDPIGGIGGGTTTCDALWMGVPVVTLLGSRMASRMTASMLDALGHPEWIADSEENYIAKVALLARNVKLRASIRSTQRVRMAHSPLCDAKGLADTLVTAFEEMIYQWRRNMEA